ncbi:EamA family transporter [Chromobacterium phragmitis]|uniref:EamA family transporter n=1 Tax=Chromobacterium phragmitis TaxID=2202141 RepID=A0A344UN18_9NEIS|nr:EamA family transporter [Chromobacterium phragmitis]AXE31284.1 EamA family transporter [Chromobacterium phragmitis]AXE36666.1 EamA family transporter [Chromobacterium phragmitis]
MSANTRTGHWRDVLLTALTPMIWGSTYIVTTQLLPPDRPFTAALLRVLPAGLLLVLMGGWRPRPAEWGKLLMLSALNIGAFQALLFVAAYRLPGGLAAVVGACQPLMVMALAWRLDSRQPAAMALWGSLAGVAGMAALLLSPGAGWDGLGMLAAFGGAVSMACGTYLTRRWKISAPVTALTGWQLTLGGLMLLPLAAAIDPPLPSLSGTQIGGYVYLALFGALLAYLLWFRGIARLSPVAVSSLGLLSPLTAVILGWALLGQSLSPQALLGMAVVLASVLAVQWGMMSAAPK